MIKKVKLDIRVCHTTCFYSATPLFKVCVVVSVALSSNEAKLAHGPATLHVLNQQPTVLTGSSVEREAEINHSGHLMLGECLKHRRKLAIGQLSPL